MYSPASPRKGLFGSAKNSPRKPILSPSGGNPFSYSSETLNLFGTNEGFIPLSRNSGGGSGSFSQPRTPVSEYGRPNSSWLPGKSLSLGSGSLGGTGGSSSTSINTAGRTVKEYDDGMRDLKKENFNLKLRIYFLEERLGQAGHGVNGQSPDLKVRPHPGEFQARPPKEDIRQSNMDLKIQVESLKYDLREKTELLKEAGLALEDLETRLSVMTIEREEERARLESKLQQMEDDHIQDPNDSVKVVLQEVKESQEHQDRSTHIETSLLSSETKDEDDRLLREVDAEIARGLHFSPTRQISSPSSTSLMLPLSTEILTTPTRPTFLDVVQENEHEVMVGQVEELEKKVDELQYELNDSELTLREAKEEVDQRLKDIISLESELVNRDIQISALEEELSQVKDCLLSHETNGHFNQMDRLLAGKETARLRLDTSNRELDHVQLSMQGLERELTNQKEKFEALHLELEIKKHRIEELESALGHANDTIACLNLEQSPPEAKVNSRECPAPPADSQFTIHTHHLSDLYEHSGVESNGIPSRLQIVTQTLHIPGSGFGSYPSSGDGENLEVDRLRQDLAKLKEYLKTSVQERKLLLKKIGTLNERMAQAQKSKLVVLQNGRPVPGDQVAQHLLPKSVAIQCNIEPKATEGVSTPSSPRSLTLRIALLQQKLSVAGKDADTLRAHLESLVDTLETLRRKSTGHISPQLIEDLKHVVLESLETSKSLSRAPTPLVLDATSSMADSLVEDMAMNRPESTNSGHSWRSSLPDPTLLDLDHLVRKRSLPSLAMSGGGWPQTLEQMRLELSNKSSTIELFEEQLEDKSRTVMEQERMLNEFRHEILRLQERIEGEQNVCVSYDHHRRSASGERIPRNSRKSSRPSSSTVPRRRGQQGYGVYSQSQTSELDKGPAVLAPLATGRALSDGEDSWSEPDVTAARRRMGLSAQALRARMADKDSSETDLEKQKSFYSLEYTEFSEEDDHTVTTFEDYSKIIEELQSHRREIEKLQSDLPTTTSVEDGPGSGDSKNMPHSVRSERTSREGAAQMAHDDAPGSLECLLSGIGDLFSAMSDLGYELDLSDSFSDSGRGSDEDDDGDDTEIEHSFVKDEIRFFICSQCSDVVCQDVERCLHRCGKLILASISTLRRLRKICCHSRSRWHEATQKLAKQSNQISQLEETVALLHGQVAVKDKVQADLEVNQNELNTKHKELQEAHVKLNENYKLVAELSNENLRLISEKVKVEELNESLKHEHVQLRAEMRESHGKMLPHHSGVRVSRQSEDPDQTSSGGDPHHLKPWNMVPLNASSPETTSSSFDFYDSSARRGSGSLATTPTVPRRSLSTQFVEAPLGVHRQFERVGVSSRPKITQHTGKKTRSSDHEPAFARSYSNLEPRRSYLSKIQPSELSSPDLGVDVGSSDPSFSSLERATAAKLQLGHPLDQVRSKNRVPIDSMLVENRQLRHERDLLLQKLVRSKGALKETLDRLTTSNQQKQDHLSPQPRRRILSSSSVLQCIGASPSRSRVTQDLLEFSRTHYGGSQAAQQLSNASSSVGYAKRPKSRRNSNMS